MCCQRLYSNFVVGKAWMAQEFLRENDKKTQAAFAEAFKGIQLTHEPHVDFEARSKCDWANSDR